MLLGGGGATIKRYLKEIWEVAVTVLYPDGRGGYINHTCWNSKKDITNNQFSFVLTWEINEKSWDNNFSLMELSRELN